MKRDTRMGTSESGRGEWGVWSESPASLPWMLGAVVGGAANSSSDAFLASIVLWVVSWFVRQALMLNPVCVFWE